MSFIKSFKILIQSSEYFIYLNPLHLHTHQNWQVRCGAHFTKPVSALVILCTSIKFFVVHETAKIGSNVLASRFVLVKRVEKINNKILI